MKAPPPSDTPGRGDAPIRESGFSYLPQFISAAEIDELVSYFASLHPLWEQRYADGDVSRRGGTGRLTRPVYWLGAWQFAALGYYSQPDHLLNRCVRGEPLPPVMTGILQRLRRELATHGDTGPLPNTCLINYYGRQPKSPGKPPVDFARLRMHRDAEPGAVVMFSVGQPAQFEFIDPELGAPAHSQWVRNRSVLIISGPEYKDRLYHRITRVRYGDKPALSAKELAGFEVRRVSVSFRHVPEQHIHELNQLSPAARSVAQPYVEQLAEHSQHYRQQLQSD